MKKLLSLVALLPLVVGGQPLSGPFPVQLPVKSLASPGSGTTASIQQTIDSFPKATTVAGIGGGELDLGPGFYYISTNLWVPGKWPFKLHVKGAGDQATFIIYTGPTNTALIRCEANNAGAVSGLTNNINLEWEGCTLSSVTNSTNFLFALENVNFVKIHDNNFVNYECLTNGNGIYAMSFEGAHPTDTPALSGISLYWGNEPNSGQGTFDIYNNRFYGLACSFFNGGIRGVFRHNKVMNNGFFKTGGTRYGHTNVFSFDYTQATQQGRAGITTGAAIVIESSGQTVVEGNTFAYCGLVLYQDTFNNQILVNAPTILMGNTYEACQYRVACWDDGSLNVASYEFGNIGVASINDQNGFPTDVVVTNSTTKVQPNAVIPTTDVITGLRAHLGTGAHLAVNGALAVTNGIIGVINASSATAGNVGQVISSLRAVGAATGLSSGVASNVVSISLTAGDWDVTGSINFVGTTATASILEGGINTTSLTLPTDGSEVFSGVTALGNGTDSVTVSRKVVNVSSTTVAYLVGKTTFSVGTVAVYGSLNARRIR